MRDTKNDHIDVLNILMTGKPINSPNDEEASVDVVLDILKNVSITNPGVVMRHVRAACECKIDGMIPLALAVLTANADDSFFSSKNSGTIRSILMVYGPEELLEYTEFLKSKTLGKGFGSRPQKWVREAIETWTPSILEGYLKQYPKQTYALFRLAHPRIGGFRGDLVKAFLARFAQDRK